MSETKELKSRNPNQKIILRKNAISPRRVQLFCPEPTRTNQEMAQEQDINYMIKKYGEQNVYQTFLANNPEYADYSDPASFEEAQNIIAHAWQQFEQLPALVRQRFGNDPKQMLDFMSKEENIPEAIKLGLATERKAPEKDPQIQILEEIRENTRAPKALKTSKSDDSGA